jgi:L-rhamnose mutarotase
MIRKAFKMAVHPGEQSEYIRRHNPIWPELAAVLREHGVQRYSIFIHRPTNELFACVEIESEERWNKIAETEVCRRWWRHMREIMPVHPDDSPVAEPLEEIFRLD